MAEHEAHGAVATAEHAHTAGHVVSPRVLLTVWAILLIFTAATVAVTRVDFGASTNLWIAMIIATVKAALVLLYFMHLRYDRPINAMWFIFALFFVALFIGGSLTDTEQYQAELIPDYAPALTQQQAPTTATP